MFHVTINWDLCHIKGNRKFLKILNGGLFNSLENAEETVPL
jgi:hypothetical protein